MKRTLTLLSALALMACAPSPGPAWLPTDVGLRYVYDVRFEGDDTRPAEVWTIDHETQTELNGHTVLVRRHSAGVRYFWRVTAEGVARVAHQTGVDETPVLDPSPLWVLKWPAQVGTEWDQTTKPYLLRRKLEIPAELSHDHETNMLWRIEALDASVTLGDGTVLQGCLRTEGQALLNLFTDPVNGFNDVPLTSREWYCPGVGLARLERSERVPAGFLLGGTLTAVLRSRP